MEDVPGLRVFTGSVVYPGGRSLQKNPKNGRKPRYFAILAYHAVYPLPDEEKLKTKPFVGLSFSQLLRSVFRHDSRNESM